MHPCDTAAQELAHIRGMIVQLERLLEGHDMGQATFVMAPEYWRARINALLKELQLPAALEKDARAMLLRLHALSMPPGIVRSQNDA